MRRFSLYLLALTILTGCSARCVPAQDLGNVGLRTVFSTVASNQTCTGSAQTFITSQSIGTPLFQNLGQTMHFATLSGSNLGFATMEIDGLDAKGNSTRISDVLTYAQLGATPQTITGLGYFPNIQISITCQSAGTFTITYSGTFSNFGNPTGGYLAGLMEKAMFLGLAANTNQQVNFQAPFGSTAGTITFKYNTAGVGGSTIQIVCSDSLLARFNQSYNLVNQTSFVQVMVVPAVPCTKIQATYVSGGVTAGTVTAEYIFAPSGTNSTGPLADSVTTCQPSGNFTACPPVTLGVNALTLPGSGTSTLSSIIDTQGAKQATLHYTCTQGTVSVNVQTYAEDGLLNGAPAPTALALVTPVSAVAANANGILQLGSESNPTVNTGTLSGTAILRLPQRALAFSFTNAGASAGTCTARLFLSY